MVHHNKMDHTAHGTQQHGSGLLKNHVVLVLTQTNTEYNEPDTGRTLKSDTMDLESRTLKSDDMETDSRTLKSD